MHKITKTDHESFLNEALIYLDILYKSAIRLTKSRCEAEDLVQETFMRAYKSYYRFERGTNCRAWLFTIMTNIFLNAYNRRKVVSESMSCQDFENRGTSTAVTVSEYAQNPGIDSDWILNNLIDDHVRDLLVALPRNFRLSIILGDIQGFPYTDIARITNVKIGTVKSRLSRARKKLQKGMGIWAKSNGYAVEAKSI